MKVKSKLSMIVCVTFALSLLSGVPAEAVSSRVEYTRAKVIRWIDGDTVKTSKGTVRLIGVDTPERNRCGYSKAKKYARAWAPVGSRIKLGNPKSVGNKDKHGRLLRYVLRGRKDVSRSQILKGARARYDSQDGYQRHPRETRYRKSDAAHANYTCSSSTPTPAPAPRANDGSRSHPPTGINSCPSTAPIKGNQGSNGWIYHQPGQQYYAVTNPEECFATTAAADAAGYRAAKI